MHPSIKSSPTKLLGKESFDTRGAYHLHRYPEIPVGKSNGMHHSIWSTSEIIIMGYWSK